MTEEQKRALDAINYLKSSIKYTRHTTGEVSMSTAEFPTHIVKDIEKALTAQTVPDGMVLVRKSSSLEPDFEDMGRTIIEQAKRIKELEAAQTVTDDEVREAVEVMQNVLDNPPHGLGDKTRGFLQTLIRAATTHKPCECDSAQYRRLEEGEIIQEGDEIDSCANAWHDDAVWKPVTNGIGSPAPNPNYPAHRQYRRKVCTTPKQCECDALVKSTADDCRQNRPNNYTHGYVCGYLDGVVTMENALNKALATHRKNKGE